MAPTHFPSDKDTALIAMRPAARGTPRLSSTKELYRSSYNISRSVPENKHLLSGLTSHGDLEARYGYPSHDASIDAQSDDSDDSDHTVTSFPGHTKSSGVFAPVPISHAPQVPVISALIGHGLGMSEDVSIAS